MAYKSPTICPLPFSSVSYSMTGQMGPCTNCYSLTDYQTIEEYWKSPELKQLQKDMKEGKRNKNCHECYMREDADAWNTRQYLEKEMPDFNFEEEPKVKMLWLRFSNLCNYRCLDCNPTTSSLIFNDFIKRGVLEGEAVVHSGGSETDLLDQVKKHVGYLEQISFSGGEPLLHWQHYEVLEYMIEKNILTTVKYFTNLSILNYRKKSLVELWSKFPSISANVGFDAMGDGCNYFRGNMSFDKTIDNINTVRANVPQCEITIVVTFTWLNAINACKMILWFLNNHPELNVAPNQVLHRYLDMRVAPQWKKEQIKKAFEEVIQHPRIKNNLDQKKAYEGLIKMMYSADYSDRWVDSISWLRDMDKWRSMNFQEAFPEHLDIEIDKMVLKPEMEEGALLKFLELGEM